MGILFSRSSQNTASKRRADDKVEPWRPKTWPQKGNYKQMTNLSLCLWKHGSKKAITSRRQTWAFISENTAPKRRLQADDKVEPWRPKTWPQKGDYKHMTNLSLCLWKHGPKKAITSRRQSWALVAENLAPKRRFDDKVEPWRPKTWPQKGDSTTKLSLGGWKPGPKKTITSRRQTWAMVVENLAPKRRWV